MEERDPFCNRAEAFEAHDDRPLSPTGRPTIGDLIVARYSRREMLKGSLGTAAAAALFGPALLAERSHARVPDSFLFEELEAGVDETHHVAKGYRAQILLRWGDPLFADAPDFDPHDQSAEKQLKQFGYKNDYIAYFPLGEDAGLLLHQS
jgi:uncharacterized protein